MKKYFFGAPELAEPRPDTRSKTGVAVQSKPMEIQIHGAPIPTRVLVQSPA